MGGFLDRDTDLHNNEKTNEDNTVEQEETADGVNKSEEEPGSDGSVEPSSEDEVERENPLIISEDTFDKFASTIAFFLGMLINWGSLNLLGFMIGMNYKYFTVSSSYVKIREELQSIIPTFMFGVLLVHLSVIYFCLSVFIGYIVRSKNLSVLNREFFENNNVVVNVRNYRSIFYQVLGLVDIDLKKES
jgi:hypothetical protein